MNKLSFSKDFLDLLILLDEYQVKYLIVGGEAVIYYGYPRFTGDIDIFYESSNENVAELWKVLKDFWQGQIPGIENETELMEDGMIFQFGVPPNRIDLINKIEGVSFHEAWESRTIETITDNKKFQVYYIGLDQLIKNKQSAARPKDQQDIKYLLKLRNEK